MDNENCLIDLSYVGDLAVAAATPKQVPGYIPFVLVPKGNGEMEVEYLTPAHEEELAKFISQGVEIVELESYIGYIKKFQTSTTAIFAIANDTGANFLTVLDYHEGGKDGAPKRVAHRVNYSPAYAPDFAAWSAIHGKPLTQEQFLDHLRKWGETITNFSDADLIELASSLDFEVSGQYSSHVERVKGGRKLLFNEQIEGSAQSKGKQVTVPDLLQMKMPVFLGGREYEMGADLLYRPQGGALRIIVEMRRVHLVIRAAVKDIVDDVEKGTGIVPFLGRLK